VVPYTDAVTGITAKTTSKDLTAFLATLVSSAVTDQNLLKPLTDNQNTEAVDSVPTKATLTAGHLSVEFDYTYTEVPFSFTTTEGTAENPVTYKNNVLLVFDLFDTAKRTTGRFDYFEYHRSHPTKANERDYLFVFQPSFVVYYSQKDPNYGTAQASPLIYRYLYYSQTGMDFSTIPHISKGLTGYLSENLITNEVLTGRQLYTTISFVTTVLLPLVMIFLFYLVFHRGGVLKKFKEYYNVAAISFIPTSLIIFLASFFLHYDRGMLFYFSLQILFYVFCLFRINVDLNSMKGNTPGDAGKSQQPLEATFETIPEENHRSSDMTASAYNPAKKNK
jgi:hypothetical protein